MCHYKVEVNISKDVDTFNIFKIKGQVDITACCLAHYGDNRLGMDSSDLSLTRVSCPHL